MTNYPPRTDQNTATLDGRPEDWTVVYNDGVTSFLRGPDGASRSGKPYIMFKSHFCRLEGNRIVPQFTLSGGGFTQADLDKARADGRAEGIAAVKAALAGVR